MRTINTYSFEELSEDSKSVAIKSYKENMGIFMEFFKENCEEQINETGFKGNVSLQYSLSCSQGDGLSFSCDYYDKLNELFVEILGSGKQKTIELIINNCSFELKGNDGRYCYCSANDISFEFDDYRGTNYLIHHLVSKVETELQRIYVNLCAKLENEGYNEIDFQYSDECISENIISNDYYYTINGKMI